ncbi:hypothetical protein AGMMS49949_04600 [Alphaproteobacteria bacterium]|nr:hypothetical protein AGMMS49949_04600 [Alphaproteobacteria bacterium]
MQKLTKRQYEILGILQKEKEISAGNLQKKIKLLYNEDLSKITVLRDLEALRSHSLIAKKGTARNTTYCFLCSNELLEYFDIQKYFLTEFDKRSLKSKTFNFSIFEKLQGLFSQEELTRIENINAKFRVRVQEASPTVLKKELERLTIEFSWKSSRIEGNTYTLLDTERLIKDHIEAEGHEKEEALMILNHKEALDYIFHHHGDFQNVTLSKVEDLHKMLMKDLGISYLFRKTPVGIVGTEYRPLDNKFQIEDAMKELLKQINNPRYPPFEKAFFTVLLISYIQPFEDGNKRTGRLLSNALLIAHTYCPLSYRSVDETEYKKAIILFYEQNSVLYFKELFIQQFEQAVEKYF